MKCKPNKVQPVIIIDNTINYYPLPVTILKRSKKHKSDPFHR